MIDETVTETIVLVGTDHRHALNSIDDIIGFFREKGATGKLLTIWNQHWAVFRLQLSESDLRDMSAMRLPLFELGSKDIVGELVCISDFMMRGIIIVQRDDAHLVNLLRLEFDEYHLPSVLTQINDLTKDLGYWLAFEFIAPIPLWGVDGLDHSIVLHCADKAILRTHYRSCVEFEIEIANNNCIKMWIIDRGQQDLPITVRIADESETLFEDTTHHSIDGQQRTGRYYSDFQTPEQIWLNSKLSIAAGERAQIRLFDATDLPGPLALQELNSLILRQHPLNGSSIALRQTIAGLLRDSRSIHQAASKRSIYLRPALVGFYHSVSVIVPVFRGLFETTSCFQALSKILSGSDIIFEIILINDNPSDAQIQGLCRDFAKLHQDVRLIENTVNAGFVKSVNTGFKLCRPGTDILLLNSDAVLSPRSIHKLRAAVYRDDGVASAAPLTNNGSFLSYPEINAANRIALNEARQLDKILERLERGNSAEIPVSVGFCMYIKRSAFDEIGDFGEEFGSGYCEEVDWCLRARDLGYKHVAALDTFVWHEGSVSFGAQERERILKNNHKIIDNKYPEFQAEIKSFYKEDPIELTRLRLFFATIPLNIPIVFNLCHSLGGGTSRTLFDLDDHLYNIGVLSLHLLFKMDEWTNTYVCILKSSKTGETLRIKLSGFGSVLRAAEDGHRSVRAIIHSLIDVHVDWITTMVEHGIKFSVMLHDYQWYCPRVCLVDHTARYCGEPEASVCESCVRLPGIFRFPGAQSLILHSVGEWRKSNLTILEQASKVIAPSEDTRTRYLSQFPEITVDVVPHSVTRQHCKLTVRPRLQRDQLHIAVIGALNTAKGAKFLAETCRQIEFLEQDVVIHLFGAVSNPDDFKKFRCFKDHGRYVRNNLRTVTKEVDIDFVLFPGVWPETFCYVLSETWELGLCPVALDIGAIAERIKTTGAGVLLESSISPKHMIEHVEEILEEIKKLNNFRFSFGQTINSIDYLNRLLP